jgi:hypothetical protein
MAKCSHATVPLVKQNACVRSSKQFLPQNTGLRRRSTPAHSTCRTGPSYIQLPPTPCFFHRVDAKSPVFLETVRQSTYKYRVPQCMSPRRN